MILVEAEADDEWEGRSRWRTLAEKAVQSAVASSRHSALIESDLSVEVSVKFTNDDEVKALNAAYRNKNRPTNVLSFPMFEAELLEPLAMADGGEVLLGDVVLAKGVCASEAADKGVPVEEHAAHLVVHGTLHLLGYDHEASDDDAEMMEAVERKAMAALGLGDPYAETEVQTQS
jgi:probable rRNA maturation factor